MWQNKTVKHWLILYCKCQHLINESQMITNVRNAVIFPQIVDGGVGELYGESSQSSVCHLLEKQRNTKVDKLERLRLYRGRE